MWERKAAKTTMQPRSTKQHPQIGSGRFTVAVDYILDGAAVPGPRREGLCPDIYSSPGVGPEPGQGPTLKFPPTHPGTGSRSDLGAGVEGGEGVT